MPRVSIVIPTYLNNPQKCIESIIAHTDADRYELILVCNGASPETKDIPTQLGIPATILWFDKPQGFSKAVNAGIKESGGELICLLNDDCVLLDQPKNHWLNLLSSPFSDPQVGITGSHKLWDEDTQHGFIIFFCAMLRRTMVEQLGGLDESLSPFYGEDITMCIEAERAGWKWVQVPVGEECRLVEVPNSEHLPEWKRQRWVGSFPVSHDAETTLGQLPNHVEIVERNRAKLRAKYGPVNTGRAEQIEGWMGHDELIWLATQAKSHDIKSRNQCVAVGLPESGKMNQARSFIGVEIGSWFGRSSRAIADNLSANSILYCVDTWGGAPNDNAFESAHDREGDNAYFQFCQNLWDHITFGRVIPLRMTSKNAADLLSAQGVKLDFCFIDGLHDEASIRADILNWQPALVEGGLLCGHDYSATFPDVIKVVDELLIAQQPPNTGIWEALDKPDITESVEGYEGFFCTEKQTNSLST